MNDFASFVSSIEIGDLHDLLREDDISSCSASIHRKRWQPVAVASDGCPGLPSRQGSRKSLILHDSLSTLQTLDSLGSISFAGAGVGGLERDDEEGPPKQIVARSSSCDSLPLMPRRQVSGGRQLRALAQQATKSSRSCDGNRPNTSATSHTARGGRKLGPPSIPRRQSSCKDQHALAKSLSLPMRRPSRCPSFKQSAGTAAA